MRPVLTERQRGQINGNDDSDDYDDVDCSRGVHEQRSRVRKCTSLKVIDNHQMNVKRELF